MSLLLALAAIGSSALGVRAECESLSSAAERFRASSLLSAVAARASSDSSLTALQRIIVSNEEVLEADKLTFFAPTDAAFARTTSATVDADLLLNHFVDDAYVVEEITVLAQFHDVLESEMARDLLLRHDGSGGLYITPEGTNLMAQVTTTVDIPTCAGMMHIIDAVLVPAGEEAINENKADQLLMKDLASLADDIEVTGRHLLNDRDVRREQLRAAKRRVALRMRLVKRKEARESRDKTRATARSTRRGGRRTERDERSAAERSSKREERAHARRKAAARAVEARQAAAEARKEAGRQRAAERRGSGKGSKAGKGSKGSMGVAKKSKKDKHAKKDKKAKKHAKDNRKQMMPQDMEDGRHSDQGGSYGSNGEAGRYSRSGVSGSHHGSGEVRGSYGSNGQRGSYSGTLGRYGYN